MATTKQREQGRATGRPKGGQIAKYLARPKAERDAELATFDRKFTPAELMPLTLAQRTSWARAKKRKPGRPVIGKGAKRVPVTIEGGLLAEVDAYVERHGMKRTQLIAAGLRLAMDKGTPAGDVAPAAVPPGGDSHGYDLVARFDSVNLTMYAPGPATQRQMGALGSLLIRACRESGHPGAETYTSRGNLAGGLKVKVPLDDAAGVPALLAVVRACAARYWAELGFGNASVFCGPTGASASTTRVP